MLQDMLRNAEAKHYLKRSYTEGDSDSSNLLGLTEEQLCHKNSKRKDTHQVSIVTLFSFFSGMDHGELGHGFQIFRKIVLELCDLFV